MSVGHYAGWGNAPIGPCFSPEVLDPFYPFPTLQSEAMAEVSFEWKETAELHLLTACLPGVRKEEVRVEVEGGGFIKISGKRTTVTEERSCSKEFSRRFRLPESGVAAELTAAMKEDGVLTVTVPKFKCSQVKVVEIA